MRGFVTHWTAGGAKLYALLLSVVSSWRWCLRFDDMALSWITWWGGIRVRVLPSGSVICQVVNMLILAIGDRAKTDTSTSVCFFDKRKCSQNSLMHLRLLSSIKIFTCLFLCLSVSYGVTFYHNSVMRETFQVHRVNSSMLLHSDFKQWSILFRVIRLIFHCNLTQKVNSFHHLLSKKYKLCLEIWSFGPIWFLKCQVCPIKWTLEYICFYYFQLYLLKIIIKTQ